MRDFPDLSFLELAQRFENDLRRARYEDGILADQLRQQPAGDFCPWGGLNPWIGGVCQSCKYHSDCRHFL